MTTTKQKQLPQHSNMAIVFFSTIFFCLSTVVPVLHRLLHLAVTWYCTEGEAKKEKKTHTHRHGICCPVRGFDFIKMMFCSWLRTLSSFSFHVSNEWRSCCPSDLRLIVFSSSFFPSVYACENVRKTNSLCFISSFGDAQLSSLAAASYGSRLFRFSHSHLKNLCV